MVKVPQLVGVRFPLRVKGTYWYTKSVYHETQYLQVNMEKSDAVDNLRLLIVDQVLICGKYVLGMTFKLPLLS